jgi:hypothetical protein
MTDIVYADFIDGTSPAATGVWNAAIINANKAAVNSKANKIGSIVVVTANPITADGVDGEYRYNRTTSYLFGPKATTWPAGVAFAFGTYETWVANGNTGPGGGTTIDEFLADQKGEDGTSFDVETATVEPANVDMVEGVLYGILSVPVPVSYNTTAGRTYTAADLAAGRIMRDCNGAGRTDTLPTAALLVASLTNPAVGWPVECRICNTSDAAETITIAAGVGGTWDANQTTASRVIPQFHSKVVTLRLTNIGSGTEAYVVYL